MKETHSNKEATQASEWTEEQSPVSLTAMGSLWCNATFPSGQLHWESYRLKQILSQTLLHLIYFYFILFLVSAWRRNWCLPALIWNKWPLATLFLESGNIQRERGTRGGKRRVIRSSFETSSIFHRSISLFDIPSLLPVQSLMIGQHSPLHSTLPCISPQSIVLCPHYFFFYPSLYPSLLLSSPLSFCLFNPPLVFYRISPSHLRFSNNIISAWLEKLPPVHVDGEQNVRDRCPSYANVFESRTASLLIA